MPSTREEPPIQKAGRLRTPRRGIDSRLSGDPLDILISAVHAPAGLEGVPYFRGLG